MPDYFFRAIAVRFLGLLATLCLSGTAMGQQRTTLDFEQPVATFGKDIVVDGYRIWYTNPFSDSIMANTGTGGTPTDVLNFLFTFTTSDEIRITRVGNLPFGLKSMDIFGSNSTSGTLELVALDADENVIVSRVFDLVTIGSGGTTATFDEQWEFADSIEFRVSSNGFPALAIDNVRLMTNGIGISNVEARLFSTAIDTGGFRFASDGDTDYMATNDASPEPIPDGVSALYMVDIPDIDSNVVTLERLDGGEFKLQQLSTYVFDTSSCVPPECRGETLEITAFDRNGAVVGTRSVSSLDGAGWQIVEFDPVWSGVRTLRLGVQAGIDGIAGTAFGFYDNFRLSPEPLEVAVDVDLWDGSNQIDPAATGPIPVGILSSSIAAGDSVDFDATTVDPVTLRFGFGEGENQLSAPFFADHNGDGLIDSTTEFLTEESGIMCGDTEVSLAGETLDGIEFMGTDVIETVNCDVSCHP